MLNRGSQVSSTIETAQQPDWYFNESVGVSKSELDKEEDFGVYS